VSPSSTSDLARRRLINQRLVGAGFRTPAEAVSWFGAVQSQDYPGAKWALGQRMQGVSDAALDRAFDAGEIPAHARPPAYLALRRAGRHPMDARADWTAGASSDVVLLPPERPRREDLVARADSHSARAEGETHLTRAELLRP
jgi:hypothetical protein